MEGMEAGDGEGSNLRGKTKEYKGRSRETERKFGVEQGMSVGEKGKGTATRDGEKGRQGKGWEEEL